MDKRIFAARIAELRMQKGVSARDMSLSLGQSSGYINNIENGKNYPSMAMFFYICEYLEVTPQQFFDTDQAVPQQLQQLMEMAKTMSPDQLEHLLAFMGRR